MKLHFRLVKHLANLPFAIGLLLTIAGFSVIGSIIKQDQSIEFYKKIYTATEFGFINSNLILQLGLNHIFTTWWFISLLILFGTSLICCTFLQQLPALNSVRKIKFYNSKKIWKRLPFKTIGILRPNGKIIWTLKKKQYKIFQSLTNYYANKGIIGRISPIIVHFSMVLVLLGTILAATSGFISQEFIPESEIFYIQNIVTKNLNAYIPQISGRVNDFWLSYNEDHSIKQFYTDLSILNKSGKEIKRETIYVNHPLKYNGLTFYQTDWDILGLRVQFDKNFPHQIPVFKQNNDIWVSWVPNQILDPNKKAGNVLLDMVLSGTSVLYDNMGTLQGVCELNEPFPLNSNLTFYGVITESGIQIKADPGLPLIYFGFFLLLISVIVSYFSYSQMWFFLSSHNLIVSGTTNRSKFKFEYEILNFILQL